MAANGIVFKLVVENNEKAVFSQVLSFEDVASIVSNANDDESNQELFAIAAKHPACSVRENVAYKDQISEEVAKELSADSSIAVLRNIVRNSKFKEIATLDLLKKLIALDVDIAQSIAGDIESYEHADKNNLAALIAENSDPSVLVSLAGCYSTPKKILKVLAENSDPNVAREAKNQMDS